jgi:hypothetical protein
MTNDELLVASPVKAGGNKRVKREFEPQTCVASGGRRGNGGGGGSGGGNGNGLVAAAAADDPDESEGQREAGNCACDEENECDECRAKRFRREIASSQFGSSLVDET